MSRNYVTAVINKPWKFFTIIANPFFLNGGPAAFTQDGKLIGITVMRASQANGQSGSDLTGDALIILPAAKVAEVAKQVPDVNAAPAKP